MLPLGLEIILLSYLFFIRLSSAQEANPCKSFGIDFQDQGAYFQDGNSSEPFTFVSQFEGTTSGKEYLTPPHTDHNRLPARYMLEHTR